MTHSITPGADFCRVLRATNGQQVLMVVETDDNEKPVLVGSASFMIDGAPALVRQAFEEVDITNALSFEGTPELEREMADSVLSDITDSLSGMLAAESGAEHVHSESCGHAH